MKWTWWMLGAVCATSACTMSTSPPSDQLEVVVANVVDGDTLDVTVNGGNRDRVRLIGIDTPESVIPGEEPECFGPEAADHLRVLAPPGTPVRLERDVEARDPYGRLLAYVYVADEMVNLALARDGYADELSIPPNTAWVSEFRNAVAQARRERLGLWAACAR